MPANKKRTLAQLKDHTRYLKSKERKKADPEGEFQRVAAIMASNQRRFVRFLLPRLDGGVLKPCPPMPLASQLKSIDRQIAQLQHTRRQLLVDLAHESTQ